MGISRSTLSDWKNKYSDISDTLKKGKEVVDRKVENALLKRALGYSYIETTKELDRATGEMKITKEITKEVVPDTTAQIFWLKNRKAKDWKNNPVYNADEESLKRLDSVLEKLGGAGNEL